MKLFLIDDEEGIRIGVGDDLRELGHTVQDFADPVDALEAYPTSMPDCVLCDLKMPRLNGLQVLEKIRAMDPHAIIIIITAFGKIESAVNALKAGAFDYLSKPFTAKDVEATLKKASSFVDLKNSNHALRKKMEKQIFEGMAGGPEMLRIFHQIKDIAATNSLVLIEGETGTGKELVANALHNLSQRKQKTLVKFSCSTFSRDILESELFGHEKGAFTGAYRQKKGRFELAEGGTLFLDEIDDLSPEIQVKLLRFLEEKTFERVGGEKTLSADVRVIAATKAPLRELVDQGLFRPDLYFRLNIFPIQLPPLRNRAEDIMLLFGHFWHQLAPERKISLDDEVIRTLKTYTWPGNVRELHHLVERLVYSIKSDKICCNDLPQELFQNAPLRSILQQETSFDGSLDEILHSFEMKVLNKALENTGGNRKQAAKNLQIPYSTLRHKLSKYGIH